MRVPGRTDGGFYGTDSRRFPECPILQLNPAQLLQQPGDVAAGIGIDVGFLVLYHPIAGGGVAAELEGTAYLLVYVGGGVGEAVVVEEEGVHRLAARDRRGVDDRDVLRGGFGAGEASRLREEHVAGIHQKRDLVRESY